MNTHDKYELPPLPFVGGLSTPDYEKAMHEWCYAAIEADRQQSDTRTSRSVEQLKEALLSRNQRFVATHSEVKNLIEYYEADRKRRGAPVDANEAYDKIDRFLRNNLYDEDYAEYSEALDAVFAPQPANPTIRNSRTVAEPVRVPGVGEIMTKIQEFASTWAVVDTSWDDGTARNRAMERKDEIRAILARYGNSHAASVGTPREFTDGTRTLRQDCISAIRDFANSRPEEDELWESWFEAAFDLCESRVGTVFDEHQAPPVDAQPRVPEYTASIGHAGQAYLDSFKYAHPLPTQFRWADLWMDMCKAASSAKQEATHGR